jgi:hypothetical protein
MNLKIQVVHECDVLVCGGGTAGVAAAIASARNGVRTTLLERYGFCGGTCVGALVHTLDGLRNCRDNSQFVVGGVGRELVDRMSHTGGMATPDNPPECVTFDPEAFKVIADTMLEEAGVEVLFHLAACDVITEEARIASVIAAGKEGLWQMQARHFIDATGDGDICAMAGAPYEKDGNMQTMSMHFRLGGIDPTMPWDVLERSARGAVDAAYAAGRAPKYGGPWVIRIREREVTLNCTRLYGDGTCTRDLSLAERQGRRDMMSLIAILCECAPGFRNAYLLACACHIGVRETRRILGDHQLAAGDILNGNPVEDVVALGSWPIDIHPSDGRVGVHPHKEDPPAPYPIPGRCLTVRGFENVLTAGRCISATHEAHGSTRVSGTAMALGQAAGTISAMAHAAGATPRALRSSMVQDRLLAQGAILSL